MRKRHYRFRKVNSRPPEHFGTYILVTKGTVFVGKYEELKKLADRMGGAVKQLNIISDYFTDNYK